MARSAEALGLASDHNLLALWSDTCSKIGGAVGGSASCPATATMIPLPPFNGAIVIDPLTDIDEELDGLQEFMSPLAVPYLLWVRDGFDDATVAAALDRGFELAGRPPAMALDPIPEIPSPRSGVEVTRVSNGRQLADYSRVMQAGFGLPPEHADRLLTLETSARDNLQAIVLSSDGEPVACSMAVVTGQNVGIHNVATVPEFRGRGLGEAATWEAVRFGAERDCDFSTLQASELGAPVYARMGFDTFAHYTQLIAPDLS